MWQKKIFHKQFMFVLLFFLGIILLSPVCSWSSEQPVSSSRLISKAMQQGELDVETYIIQTLKAYFSPHRVDPAFASSIRNEPTRNITPLLDIALRYYDYFSPESRAYLDVLLKRPTNTTYKWPWDTKPDFYLPDPVSTFEPAVADYPNIGGKFKFWYVTHDTADGGDHVHKTTLDFVKTMADAFEKVYKTQITDHGYSAPPNDPGGDDYGGDEKFDIYLMNTGGEGVYGYVAREGLDSGNSYYSYMVMDRDFTAFVKSDLTAEQAMQATAAHEYHHVVQNGINGLADTWYKEATSTWMETQVYPDIRDNLQYLNGGGFFSKPQTSLDHSSFWYSSWIWNQFLSTKWDSSIVKDVWDYLDPEGDNNALDAIVKTLTDKSSSLEKAFTEFAAKNYSKIGFYKDAVHYDDIRIVNRDAPHMLDYSTADSHLVPEQTARVNHMAVKYYKFVPGPSLDRPTQMTIRVDGADLKDVSAVAVAKRTDGTFVEYSFHLDAEDKTGEVGIADFSTRGISEVVLALVNYSKDEDDLEFKYEASLMKGVAFCIDDTGSMGSQIASAKAAAIRVLDKHAEEGVKNFYTLLSFKDGPATLRGQSSDEETMKGLINSLYASGGDGCPESSLTCIRQASSLAPGADIFMMTDASSNSYGVDNTYATWGEVAETLALTLKNKNRLHSIIYGTCYRYFRSGYSEAEAQQCPGCFLDGIEENCFRTLSSVLDDPAGEGGYNRISAETGGLYFRIASYETEAAVEIILHESTADNTIAFFEDSLSEEEKTYALPLDDSISQLQVVLNGNPDSSLSLKLTNPAGDIISDDMEGVSVTSVGKSVFYLIEDSALGSGGGIGAGAGEWSATVSGTGEYRFSSSCVTANPMYYTGDTFVGVGSRLSLNAQVSDEVPGLGFQLIELDGTSPVNLFLSTSDSRSYTGSHLMNAVGSYRLLVSGDGGYQRMHPSKITVGNLDVTAPRDVNVAPGASLTHQFMIKNLGDEEDTYDIFVTSSQGWSNLVDIPDVLTISGLGLQLIDIEVVVPEEAMTGQSDILALQAVSQTDPLISDTASVETAVYTETYTVTPSAGPGGSINPETPQNVGHGRTTTFTVTPDSGYTATVEGTCGGILAGTLYTTDFITEDCTVEAAFTTGGPDAPISSANLAQAMFVAYFGRAANPGGLDFWVNGLKSGEFSESDIASSMAFAASGEAQVRYAYLNKIEKGISPHDLDIAVFINSIYSNLFNRDPEEVGRAFWFDSLKGGSDPGEFLWEVIKAAKKRFDEGTAVNPDWENIFAKIEVANVFTEEFRKAGLEWNTSMRSLTLDIIRETSKDNKASKSAEMRDLVSSLP